MSDKNKNGKEEGCDKLEPKWECPEARNVTHPLRYYEFSPEEMKALEECDKESFYQRCIPFSSLFAAATYACVKNGILKRNPHFGAFPKVLMAAMIGHCYGRISYLMECDKKLRHLPNDSHLGSVMRQYYIEKQKESEPAK